MTRSDSRDDQETERRASWRGDLFAVAVTAATFGVRFAMDAQLEGQPALVLFTLPIMLSAYVGGLRAGLLATAISYLGASYYLLPPVNSFTVAARGERWLQIFLVLAGVGISGINELLHRARVRIDRASRRRERDEQAARIRDEEVQRFRSLLEAAPDAMVIVGQSGRIDLINSQTEKLFGYNREELLGQLVEILVPNRFHGKHPQHRAHFSSQPRVRAMGADLELRAKRKDGSEFPVEISLSPLETSEGRLTMSAIRDVSDRKALDDLLRQKNAELESANQAKDVFLANMSHELRTPLNAIIGFTGTLLMRLPGPLTADQEKQLTTVQSSARHLLALINDLLDVAKIDAGKADFQPEALACRVLVQEIIQSLAPLAQRKGLTLEGAFPDHELMIHTDRRAITQILLNLTNNALKFTEHGAVRIVVRHEGVGEERTVEIRIEDTGRGIRPEDQLRLFQPFTQVDTSSTRSNDGTGLGLHLSRKLAEMLGGQITLRSEYGKGSVFSLTLKAS